MDRHTFLVNKSLGLSSNLVSTKWPKTLLRLGYEIHGIEHSVHVEGGNVSPDIILTNGSTGHALVIDCKSGANVDLEQDSGYCRMSTSDLHRAGVPVTMRSHTPIYAINEEHVGRIRGHTDLPLVVFGSHRIHGIGNPGSADLADELCRGVPLDAGSAPDLGIYPFSILDAHGHIDGCVADAVSRHLLTRPELAGRSLAARADASAILRKVHPLHALFSRSHRSELRRAVAQSIARQEGAGAPWLEPASRPSAWR